MCGCEGSHVSHLGGWKVILKPFSCLFSAGSLFSSVPCFLPKGDTRTGVQSWKKDPSLSYPVQWTQGGRLKIIWFLESSLEGILVTPPLLIWNRETERQRRRWSTFSLSYSLSPLSRPSLYLLLSLSLSLTLSLSLSLSLSHTVFVYNSGEKLKNNNNTTEVGIVKVKSLFLQQVRLLSPVSFLLVLHVDLLLRSHAGVLNENRETTAEKFNESAGNLGLCIF